MAITYDAGSADCCAYCASGAGRTWAHTVGTGEDRILILAITTFAARTVSTVTYAGQAMTPHPDIVIPAGWTVGSCYIYYLVNPPSGANNINVVLNAATDEFSAVATSYENVDVDDPWDAWAVDFVLNTPFGVLSNTVATSQSQAVYVMYYSHDNGNNASSLTLGATARQTTGVCLTAATYRDLVAGDDVGATPSQDYGGSNPTGGAGLDALLVGAVLNPALPAAGRPIEYIYDMWDPDAEVRAQDGRAVPPDQIEHGEWIEVEGIKLPGMEIYENNIIDPSRSLVAEISAAPNSASIKTSKSQFAEIFLARALAGRG